MKINIRGMRLVAAAMAAARENEARYVYLGDGVWWRVDSGRRYGR